MQGGTYPVLGVLGGHVPVDRSSLLHWRVHTGLCSSSLVNCAVRHRVVYLLTDRHSLASSLFGGASLCLPCSSLPTIPVMIRGGWVWATKPKVLARDTFFWSLDKRERRGKKKRMMGFGATGGPLSQLNICIRLQNCCAPAMKNDSK